MTYSKDHQDKAIQYSGQFKQGEPNGNGTFTWADGSTYIGHYENGFRSGYGVLYYNKEHPLEHYEGIFLKNKYQGQGKLFWKNGDNYEGSFANDALNGFGIYTFSKNNVYGNNKYSGYFKDNKRNGNGTMISNNGHKYAGIFQNNLWDGYGILYFPTQDLRHMYQGYHERGYL